MRTDGSSAKPEAAARTSRPQANSRSKRSCTASWMPRSAIATSKELIHEIYYRDVHRHTIAGIAGLVQRAMDGHDAIAADILGRAGGELASAASSVIGRLEMRGNAFPTVLAGGIFRGIPWLV